MYQEIIKKIRPELEKTIEYIASEFGKIRTGQASPALVADIMVDVFGQRMSLKQLAAITIPEPRQILVDPWDKSYLEPIEKALHASSLGTSPIVDKNSVRITLPEMTQEYRDTLLRLISEKAEEGKKTLRRWREEAWGEIQEKTRKGEIREDDKFRGKEELQKIIDEYTEKIDKLVEKKTKEVQL